MYHLTSVEVGIAVVFLLALFAMALGSMKRVSLLGGIFLIILAAWAVGMALNSFVHIIPVK